MRFAVVDVEVERAVGREKLPGACQAGLEEGEVVVERVVVAERAQQLRAVAPAPESDSLPAVVGGNRKRPPRLRAPCVEGRIQVGEVETARRQPLEHGGVLPGDHQVVVEGDLLSGRLDSHEAGKLAMSPVGATNVELWTFR